MLVRAAESKKEDRKRKNWWKSFAETGRAPRAQVGVEEEIIIEDGTPEWTMPEWEAGADGCSPVQFEVVWTISYVSTL